MIDGERTIGPLHIPEVPIGDTQHAPKEAAMNALSSVRPRSIRSLALIVAAAISLLIGAQSVAASVSINVCPADQSVNGAVDVAAPCPYAGDHAASGGFTSAAPEIPVLIGSGPEREEVAHSQAEVATLVGSGPEREEVAHVTTPTLVGSGPEREEVAQVTAPTLVGSGPEREEVALVQSQASSDDESAVSRIGPSA
jgi:hypothetical protein